MTFVHSSSWQEVGVYESRSLSDNKYHRAMNLDFIDSIIMKNKILPFVRHPVYDMYFVLAPLKTDTTPMLKVNDLKKADFTSNAGKF